MRVLIAIANYGFKNETYVNHIIREYSLMPCETDIIILSEVQKKFEYPVEILVGLPSKDPWSLPFGHQRIFAERADDYDLFIYSEDDMLITLKNINAFLEITEILPPNKIAGFLRYELDLKGKKWYPEFHACAHWEANTIKKIEQFSMASFSNYHSACYMLTPKQLKTAIQSSGYLVGPHQGVYDLLCTAATDVYTQCGFEKLICISRISDFLVHHLPNNYQGKLGIGEHDFDCQIDFMLSVGNGQLASRELSDSVNNVLTISPGKMFYNPCDLDMISVIPPAAQSVLSIGCGCASTESILVRKGLHVTAIPLDSIVGALAGSKGIRVTEPDLDLAFEELKAERFDCIILDDILHRHRYPVEFLSSCAKMLDSNGSLVIRLTNLSLFRLLKQKLDPIKKTDPVEGTIRYANYKSVRRWLSYGKFNVTKSVYVVDNRFVKTWKSSLSVINRFLADRIYIDCSAPR